ncbi:hypothetical protein N7533_000064 [Penicillium manginii]|uniref:uncharacterized protein n=1 Tax=Penicillium manginii TaxID=203109 RepID=UPI0025489AF1|nr:uncharacterized protein N7533_000064 [Penicillium manginii]KAJ5767481.1 hypothetical protein N7533_000064 [Penicillium manginii]
MALNLGHRIDPRVRRATSQVGRCAAASQHAQRGVFSDLADGWVHFGGLSCSLGFLIALAASLVIIGFAFVFSRDTFLNHLRVVWADILFESFEGMLDDMAYSRVDALLEDLLAC